MRQAPLQPFQILAIEAENLIARALGDDSGFAVRSMPARDLTTGAAVPTRPGPDLIVLRTTMATVVRDGTALLAANPQAQLLILLPSVETARFQAGLPFMPRLGRAWSASVDTAPKDLSDLIRSAAAAARSRTSIGSVFSKINEQLGHRVPREADPHDNHRRLSERYFTTLLATAPDAFFALDDKGKFLALNDAAATLFGIGNVLDGANIAGQIAPDGLPALEAALASAGTQEVVRLIDLPMAVAGSDSRWIELSLARVTDAPEGGPSLSGTAREITDRKRLELELRVLNDTLEARVAERTDALEEAHAQLRQAQKLEAMGSLTGGVAHDFNNLLTPILGGLDMLQRRGVGDERAHRTIAGALASAERAKTLVQRLLAFARRQPLQPVAVDIAELVRGMATLIVSTCGPQIALSLDLADDLPLALIDANQIEMALLNLAVNSADAMPTGGTLRIAASCRDDAEMGHHLRLAVIDTGAGMDEATLARAIEPFFSTKGVGRGTGLGLSMVHGVAAQLGGRLEIVSRTGMGTSVELWLPLAHTVLPASDLPTTRDDTVELHGTVLLVDDEELVRRVTAEMLADLGYDVVEAGSAEEALAKLETGLDPDLLVTDHLMPGITGTALARLVLATRHIPVLIISGYADVETIAPDLPRLTKPFQRDQLADALKREGRSSTGSVAVH